MGNEAVVEQKETAVAEQAKSRIVEYMAGSEKVQLGPATVRKYLVSGNKENVTEEELIVFMNLCRFQHLNPWLKEAYLIKYGNEAATMVVSKEAFQKRAEANPSYDGSESGIIVQKADGSIEYRKGMLYLEDEKIAGGYAEVWRKDRKHSSRIEVTFSEYAVRNKQGGLASNWAKKPGTMIRKVALAQALRDAFPGDFGGMYMAEEQGVAEGEKGAIDVQSKDVTPVAVDPFEAAKAEKEAEVVQDAEPVYEPVEEAVDITE